MIPHQPWVWRTCMSTCCSWVQRNIRKKMSTAVFWVNMLEAWNPPQFPQIEDFRCFRCCFRCFRFGLPNLLWKIAIAGSNAYTEEEFTCYYFSVNADFLEGALDRFSQLFLAAGLLQSCQGEHKARARMSTQERGRNSYKSYKFFCFPRSY